MYRPNGWPSDRVSLTNLVEHFNNVESVPVKRETIAGYLRLLESAKVLYKCERFDLKSRRSLRGEEKYYLTDLGIYYARNTDARVSYGPSPSSLSGWSRRVRSSLRGPNGAERR